MNKGSMKRVAMAKIPMCDICKVAPAMYDAPTVGGSWAYQCRSCNRSHGMVPGAIGSELIQADAMDDEPIFDPAIVEAANDMGLYPEDVINLLADSGMTIQDLGY